jgi:hypothetical protein
MVGDREIRQSWSNRRWYLVPGWEEVFGVGVAVEIQGAWAQVGTRGACAVEPQPASTGMLRAFKYRHSSTQAYAGQNHIVSKPQETCLLLNLHRPSIYHHCDKGVVYVWYSHLLIAIDVVK